MPGRAKQDSLREAATVAAQVIEYARCNTFSALRERCTMKEHAGLMMMARLIMPFQILSISRREQQEATDDGCACSTTLAAHVENTVPGNRHEVASSSLQMMNFSIIIDTEV